MSAALFARGLPGGHQVVVLDIEVDGALVVRLPTPAAREAEIALGPAGDLFPCLSVAPASSHPVIAHEVLPTADGVLVRARTLRDDRNHRVRVGLTFPSPRQDAIFLPLASFRGAVQVFVEGLTAPGWSPVPARPDRDGWSTGTGVVGRTLAGGENRWIGSERSTLPVLIDWLAEQGDWRPAPCPPELLQRLAEREVAPELLDLFARVGHAPRGLSPVLDVAPVSPWEALETDGLVARGPGGRWTVDHEGRLTGAPWQRLNEVWDHQLRLCLTGAWPWRDEPSRWWPANPGATRLRTVPIGPRRDVLRKLTAAILARRERRFDLPGVFTLVDDVLTVRAGPPEPTPWLEPTDAAWLHDLLSTTASQDDALVWPGLGTLRLE